MFLYKKRHIYKNYVHNSAESKNKTLLIVNVTFSVITLFSFCGLCCGMSIVWEKYIIRLLIFAYPHIIFINILRLAHSCRSIHRPNPMAMVAHYSSMTFSAEMLRAFAVEHICIILMGPEWRLLLCVHIIIRQSPTKTI